MRGLTGATNKVFLALLGLGVLSLALAGCGSGGTSGGNPQPVVTVTVTTGSYVPSPTATSSEALPKGHLGDALTLVGMDDAKVEVVVQKTKRVPAKTDSGFELHPALFGVFITVKNVADAPYSDTTATAVVLVDNADATYKTPRTYDDLPDELSDMTIAPGDKRSGWVYFEVPENRRPRLVQFTPDSLNVDYSVTQIGEWSLQ